MPPLASGFAGERSNLIERVKASRIAKMFCSATSMNVEQFSVLSVCVEGAVVSRADVRQSDSENHRDPTYDQGQLDSTSLRILKLNS